MPKKTKEQISFNMKQVKNKDSDIELMLRKELWSRGLRYRKNVTGIIGKPDIVFKAKKVAVFCDSEFWHGYDWENRKGDFKSNKDFWIPKIERNIERDKEVSKAKKILEEISKDEHERYLAELRQKYIMDQKAIEDAGFDKGLKVGIEQGKRAIAKELKKQNVDISIISKTTGLTKEEIEKLK